jgi:magnesium transporter
MAAILFAPTLIAGIYGMNFEHMPELSWRFAYPLALLAMVVGVVVLYLLFKRNHWM